MEYRCQIILEFLHYISKTFSFEIFLNSVSILSKTLE